MVLGNSLYERSATGPPGFTIDHAPPEMSDLEPDRQHRKKVHGNHGLHVIVQKGPPGLRRWLATSRHILANTRFSDVDAELEQFAVNARCAPQRILPTHLANQVPRFLGDRRSSRVAAAHLPGPEQSKPFRCHWITVSGFTMTRADRQPDQNRDSRAQRNRSAAVSLGRFTERCSTLT